MLSLPHNFQDKNLDKCNKIPSKKTNNESLAKNSSRSSLVI